MVPSATKMSSAINTTPIDTDAFTNVASSPCPKVLSININIHPPLIIPIIPATSVKKTASTTICLLI
mgnify:CR=1 FL=1